ncbi:MAG: cytochrome c [Hyphomicrobiales bacterium]|nr:cytochrome c [Hyphomicrobiales bacterium]
MSTRTLPSTLLFALATSLTVAVANAEETPSWYDMWDPSWTWREDAQDPDAKKDAQMRMRRHRKFMTEGVPEEFTGVHNPLGYDDAIIQSGAKLYAQTCAQCHGTKGLGDGAAAGDLSPSPALLAHLINKPIAVDEYLLWTISKGGVQFNTAMPAFEDNLSQHEIWRIISYMRSGFPALKPEGTDADDKAEAIDDIQ